MENDKKQSEYLEYLKYLLDCLVELKNITINKRYKDCKTRDDAEKNKEELREEWKKLFFNSEVLTTYNNSPCNCCVLPKSCKNKKEPYISGPYIHPAPLVFFTEGMKKKAVELREEKSEESVVDIMFVSRDPHAYYGEVLEDLGRYKNRSFNEPVNELGVIIISFVGEKSWEEFLNCVEYVETDYVPKIYWTHIVKCNTNNDPEYVNQAFNSCQKYLKAEIWYLRPKKIVAFGRDAIWGVAKAVEELKLKDYNISKLLGNRKKVIKKNLKDILEFTCNFIKLPHPSGANKGNYQFIKEEEGVRLEKKNNGKREWKTLYKFYFLDP